MANIKDANFAYSQAITGPAAAAEIALISSNAVSMEFPNAHVVVYGYTYFTVGTAGSSVALRLRRGVGLAGTNIGNSPFQNVTAGNTYILNVMAEDEVTAGTSLQYTLTMQVTSATGSTAVGEAGMIILVL